jgi:apolipoprotein N-acyltransferase
MSSFFDRVSAFLETRKGAKRFFLAMLFGFLSALAFPPFNAVPLLWICFPALVFLIKSAKGWGGAFGAGWAFAFGQLVPNLYWIAGALFVDIGQFWWLVPFAVAGLPALFAVYFGLAAMAARPMLSRPTGPLFFAMAWFAADVARGHLLTGFPWDVTGYVWGAVPQILQITSVIGIYGLGLVTLAVVVQGATKKGRCVLVGLTVLVLLFGWGEWRLLQAPKDFVSDSRVRLVQPSVSQGQKWHGADREDRFQNLLALSFNAPSDQPLAAIVWPETAVPFFLSEDVSRRLILASLLGEKTKLITGVVQRAASETHPADIDYFNSLIVIDGSAHIVAGYDKSHLVPFGEYVPFRDYIPLQAIASVGMNFKAGDGVRTLHVKGLPQFSPLVCYEAIFPSEVASRQEPPKLLVNVTNDAWYEGTTGPSKHFLLVRVRAIEEGVPLIRVSNRGVTAMVDAYGRVRARHGGAEPGFVDSDIPVTTVDRTLFGLYGNFAVGALFLCYFIFVFLVLKLRHINHLCFHIIQLILK